MDPVDPVSSRPPGDGAVADPGRLQLRPADHARLARSKSCQSICVEFPPLSGGVGTQNGHGRWSRRQTIAGPRRMCPFIAEVVPRSLRTRLEGVSEEVTETPL